jgi:hypothetical protein
MALLLLRRKITDTLDQPTGELIDRQFGGALGV